MLDGPGDHVTRELGAAPGDNEDGNGRGDDEQASAGEGHRLALSGTHWGLPGTKQLGRIEMHRGPINVDPAHRVALGPKVVSLDGDRV